MIVSQASQQNEPPPPRAPHIHREPKLIPLSPEDDIESHWHQRRSKLFNLTLCSKVKHAYVLMDISNSEDYEKDKGAILAKYEITADTYRRRFQSPDINQGETLHELYIHLKV